MARKTRQRISYVLPLADEAAGHRLGVNGLAIDEERSTLYSAGRDGVICAWDVNLQPSASSPSGADKSSKALHKHQPDITLRQQLQAHTHWINDITLVENKEALVSASSDISVKLWRPHAENIVPPQTIGVHDDYVKCLASPSLQSNWVAAGGLDRKIRLWDLHGHGQKLEIEVPEEETKVKGSVYALAANESLIAAGGPESIVKLWDPKSGKRVTQFIGHTDNIRAALISDDNDKLLTASSDKTVKVWSIVAGRCMHTFTMHNDSVWCLLPGDRYLSVFYSGDRSGYVAKTDVRNVSDLDDGLSIALCQEHTGINKIISAGYSLWTATSSSSINRWADADTSAGIQIPDNMRTYRSNPGSRSKVSVTSASWTQPSSPEASSSGKLPINCVLRLSNTAGITTGRHGAHGGRLSVFSGSGARKSSIAHFETEVGGFAPLRSQPIETIEGQNGLIKHTLLNDKRRVLALDTAGEVIMWDLLHCMPIKSCGKRPLEEVAAEHKTTETVANWCAVDTRTGTLTCILEEDHCFDAEIYADELPEARDIEFREDQRINLGKWVLRYLFSALIEEEIRRDERYRRKLLENQSKTVTGRIKPPLSINLPESEFSSHPPIDPGSVATPRPWLHSSQTPGLSIGVASPSSVTASPGLNSSPQQSSTTLVTAPTNGPGSARGSTEGSRTDYFNAKQAPTSNPDSIPKLPTATPATPVEEKAGAPTTPGGAEKSPGPKDATPSSFGKRLRSTFSAKKFGRNNNIENAKQEAASTEEKGEDASDSRSGKTEEAPVFEDTFLGIIQRIRAEYSNQLKLDTNALNENGGFQSIETSITPSLPNDTPVLKPPLTTTIIIQEDRPDSAVLMDLFEGKLGNLGIQADLIEKVAPMWLAETLLRSRIPPKEIVKISFVLEPYNNQLPSISTTEGAERLNANHMLRARKVLAYIAERLEPPGKEANPEALRPEEYLELSCNGKTVPPKMTLATIRSHVWRGGGDVVLYYRANGRKQVNVSASRVETKTENTTKAPSSETKPS